MANDPGFLFFGSHTKLTLSVNASKLKSESVQRKTLGKGLPGVEYGCHHLLTVTLDMMLGPSKPQAPHL